MAETLNLSTSSIRVPNLEDDLGELVNELLDQLRAKTRRNLLRASYYDGKRAAVQIAAVMPPQYETLGIVLGWAAKGVDLLARRCNLNGLVWPGGDLDSLGYRELWDGNRLGSEVDQGITSALIHATSFIVTTRGGPGEPAGLIHFKDALSATGKWDDRARRLTSLLSVTKRDEHGISEFALYIDRQTITISRVGSQWRVVDRQSHPFDCPADPLVYRPRLGRAFGSSRISRPVMSLQDQAVREVMRLEGHMDTYSWPEYWMLGADASIFKNADGSPKASWQIMLGRIKGIPDNEDAPEGASPRADVKQFAASSPEPHLAALNGFAKLFARETSLPDTALAITDVSNPTSAESYDASQYELIAEAEGATDDWSPALRRAVTRALAAANGLSAVPEEWNSIDTRWRDPRYLSRAAQADAGMKQLTAIPWLADTEVGLELLGLDEQQLRRAMSEKRKAEAAARIRDLAAAAQAQRQQPVSDDADEG